MSATPRKRVAVFGFDAAEPELIERGIAEGWLPTMRRLLEEGQGTLLGPPPSGFFNTSWIATVTGTDVFDHRAVLDRQLDSGTYRIRDVRADAVMRPPFWRYLSDAGLSSTVVSVYSTPLVPGLRGTQVLGWGAIDPYTAKFDERIFEPPETEEALLRGRSESRQRPYPAVAPEMLPVTALTGIVCSLASTSRRGGSSRWSSRPTGTSSSGPSASPSRRPSAVAPQRQPTRATPAIYDRGRRNDHGDLSGVHRRPRRPMSGCPPRRMSSCSPPTGWRRATSMTPARKFWRLAGCSRAASRVRPPNTPRACPGRLARGAAVGAAECSARGAQPASAECIAGGNDARARVGRG